MIVDGIFQKNIQLFENAIEKRVYCLRFHYTTTKTNCHHNTEQQNKENNIEKTTLFQKSATNLI